MEFWEWLQVGKDNGWTSDVHCNTHDGAEMTEEEVEKWNEGEDPCIFVIRVWE